MCHLKIKHLLLSVVCLITFQTLAQINLNYSHSVNINNSKLVYSIDGNSSKNYFYVLNKDIISNKDSIFKYAIANGEIISKVEIIKYPIRNIANVISDSFAYFLMSGNEILIYKLSTQTFLFHKSISINDKGIYYNNMFLGENGKDILLSSQQCPRNLKDGFLKLIKLNNESSTGFEVMHNKIDSLNFLSIYSPLKLFDRSESGLISIIDFEGNLKIIKDGQIFKSKVFVFDFDIEEKKKVLFLQKKYDLKPTTDLLEKELDPLYMNNPIIEGILISDSYLMITYNLKDTSNLDYGIPVMHNSVLYSYKLDSSNLSVITTPIYIINDSGSKSNSTKFSQYYFDYIDLYKTKLKFLNSEYFCIYYPDLKDFIISNPMEKHNRKSFNVYNYNNKNSGDKLLVFKISSGN